MRPGESRGPWRGAGSRTYQMRDGNALRPTYGPGMTTDPHHARLRDEAAQVGALWRELADEAGVQRPRRRRLQALLHQHAGRLERLDALVTVLAGASHGPEVDRHCRVLVQAAGEHRRRDGEVRRALFAFGHQPLFGTGHDAALQVLRVRIMELGESVERLHAATVAAAPSIGR
jgi:hypothetical protein